jgi:hypothetical protein
MKFLLPLAVALAVLCGLPGAARAASPAAQCAAQGTDDTLRPVPENMAGAVNQVFGTAMPAAMVAAGTVYRCDGGQVWVCSAGANLNCGKADVSRVPNEGEIGWCKQNAAADYIPAYVTGHETVYAWGCRSGAPVIVKQALQVDGRGFVSQFWKRLP